MQGSWSVRLQAALVAALFLGSLSPLLLQVISALELPQRELRVRETVREANRRMAEAAAPVAKSLLTKPGGEPKDLDRSFRDIANQVLADYRGVEGGFYLTDGEGRFSGFAYPTGLDGSEPSPPRNDPPPLETPYIRLQAQQCLSLEPGERQVQVRDVGPSRVVVVTEAVGRERPARVAAWTMFRLTGPEDLEGQMRRFRVSVGLALGGMAVSLLLTVNLGRTLKRQRREQECLRDELRRSEHLASLGKLLAGVAHEVRTPLAGIRSTIQLWERLPETAQNPESRAAVIQAVDRLNEIVSRLLYFARVDNADRQPTSLNRVLTETLNLLEAQAASQSVTVERDFDPNLPEVSGSASAIRQVFLNLATNALQAMPQGGVLRCSTRAQPQQGAVEVGFTDTGPGISRDDQRHLFEPFFTTRPEGTGLGLALCREIVTQHGGRIDVESEEGQGVTFRLCLPAAR